MLRRCCVFLPLILASACGLPKDPEGTSDRIASTRELRVGVTDNRPWVDAHSPEPAGIEADLVRHFAERLGAKILWSRGSEAALAEQLKHHDLDIAVGGFEVKTPWKSVVGVTQPFARTPDKKKHVFLVAPGENRFILTLDTYLAERMVVPGRNSG